MNLFKIIDKKNKDRSLNKKILQFIHNIILIMKKFKDLKVSTMVNSVPLTGNIDLLKTVSLIRLYYPKFIKSNRKKKIDFPNVASNDIIETSERIRIDNGHCFPGDITYTGYRNIKRGMIRSKKNAFKNAIGIDIASPTKFVSCKIFSDSIHISGAKSDEMIIYSVEKILENIIYVQNIIDKIHQDPEKTLNTINWVKQNTKGIVHAIVKGTHTIVDDIDIDHYDINNNIKILDHKFNMRLRPIAEISLVISTNIDLSILHENNICVYIYHINSLIITLKQYPKKLIHNFIHIYNTLKYVNIDYTGLTNKVNNLIIMMLDLFKEFCIYYITYEWYDYIEYKQCIICPPEYYNNLYPESIDADIAKYLISISPDYIFHDIYESQLNWILTVDKLYTTDNNEPISMCQIKYISINYNYKIGYEVYLPELINMLQSMGIHAEQDELCVKYVTVHIPYIIPDDYIMHIQKKKIKVNKNKKSTTEQKQVHSFMIYTNGSVTQSGPYPPLNEIAYNKLMTALIKIKPHIINTMGDKFSKNNSIIITNYNKENILSISTN
uniref:Uncharacterized protein n=1 Tax=Pithovirus LCPAC102 TaxID=2506587 RepID=A0A481Z2Y1_9VIRU|nr:MAG: uncharacterized protein LCPAC102_00060 [Pithovirus LCPAC102]